MSPDCFLYAHFFVKGLYTISTASYIFLQVTRSAALWRPWPLTTASAPWRCSQSRSASTPLARRARGTTSLPASAYAHACGLSSVRTQALLSSFFTHACLISSLPMQLILFNLVCLVFTYPPTHPHMLTDTDGHAGLARARTHAQVAAARNAMLVNIASARQLSSFRCCSRFISAHPLVDSASSQQLTSCHRRFRIISPSCSSTGCRLVY